jgi:hypothetical protein
MINSGTNSETCRVMIHFIVRWLDGQPASQLKELAPEAPNYLRQAILDQNKIGWYNFMRGRLAKKWKQAYINDRDTTKDLNSRPITADQWGKQIVKLTLEFALESWYCRNEIEHERDKNNIPMVKEITCKNRLD